MKTSLCRRGLAALLASLLFLSIGLHTVRAQDAVPSIAATAIASVPYKITKPGVYILKKDLVLTSASATAITILTGDVTLDLGMHSLTSGAPKDSTNASYGITFSGTGSFAIRNGSLRGFKEAIYSTYNPGTETISVEKITCSGCGVRAIDLQAYSGETKIDDCVVRDTGYSLTGQGYYMGIYTNGRTIRITNCRVAGTTATSANNGFGIYCDPGASGTAVVANNYVVGAIGSLAYSTGLVVSDGYQTVTGNSIFKCNIGIWFVNNTTTKYADNLTVGCTTGIATGGTGFGFNN